MVKDFLAFLGLVFLTLIIIIGVGIIAYFYNTFDLVTIPEQFIDWLNLNETTGQENLPTTLVEWNNPLDEMPTATLPVFRTNTPQPSLTPSPIPALDPAIYRVEVNGRLKRFAAALEDWRDLNNQLVSDRNLIKDPVWIERMKISLEVVELTGTALADVSPAPDEYKLIDSWLNQIPEETQGLRQQYLLAIETGNIHFFQAAGDHFARIKEVLTGVVNEMLAMGWVIE